MSLPTICGMGSGLVSPGHLVVLLVIALLVFGPKRLPELGRSLGAGMRGFKDAISGDDDEPAHPEPVRSLEAEKRHTPPEQPARDGAA